MKKFTIIILILPLCFGLNAQDMINGGFEEIVPNSSNPYPEHWGSLHLINFSLCFFTPQTGVISTDSYSGEYSIKMETLNCGSEGLQEEGGYSIYHFLNGFPEAISVPYSERPDFLSFYFKFISQGGDSAKANLLLFNYDSVTPDLTSLERIDTVAIANVHITQTITEYTQFTVPIEYLSDEYPSYIHIRFRTGEDCELGGCHEGTTLWVDDVELSGGTLSTDNSVNADLNFSIFPNPSSEWFRIRSKNRSGIKAVSILDYLGREVKRWRAVQSKFSIDELPSGTYLVRIETSDGVSMKKLLKAN